METTTQHVIPKVSAFERAAFSWRMRGELRSDHAGEVGAVMIYAGILAVSRDPEVIRFAEAHRAAELEHREFFEEWLPAEEKSRLIPLWKLSGWLLGAIGALGGKHSVFLTIDAVETFVVQHYQRQIDALSGQPEHANLVAVLHSFQADEAHHRDDAAHRASIETGRLLRVWAWIVGSGSALAVHAARAI